MRTIYTIKPCSPFEVDVSMMIDALDSYQRNLYPAESKHLDSRQLLSEPNCQFLGAYREGILVGTGAVRKFADFGELKRFYIPESMRGNGIAELLIASLELWLIRNGIKRSCLETGIHQHAALRFYGRLGYKTTGSFGSHHDDPLSVFMAKDLAKTELVRKKWDDPFYLVAFTSVLLESTAKYHAIGDEMTQLVSKQQGYIGSSSNRNSDGSGVTISYWRDLDAILAWRNHSQHLEAQRLGREEFYKKFQTSLACVEGLFISMK